MPAKNMLPRADTKASLLPGSLQVVYTIKSNHNQLFAKETFISRECPLVTRACETDWDLGYHTERRYTGNVSAGSAGRFH